VLLLLNPVAISTGEIAMRSMGKMPETIVSLYNNLTLGMTMVVLIILTGGTFDEWNHWGAKDWMAMIALSCTVLISQTLRFMALQNHKASALQPLAFLNPIYQFIADELLFHTVFTIWQMTGFTLVVGIFLAKLIYYHYEESKKKEEPLASQLVELKTAS
jgi:drug/metabolite transporter (DMT)-like permease